MNHHPPPPPLVSYVIPCYNCEDYIAECLKSVFSQIGVHLQALVIDDGSTDGSLEVVNKFISANPRADISLLFHPNNENLGVSASRSLGIRHAQGKYIGFLDADDLLLSSHKTSEQVSIFMQFPNVVLIHSGVKIIGDIPNNAMDHEQHFVQRSELGVYHLSKVPQSLDLNCIANSTVLVRKEALSDFSYSQLFQIEDFVLWHLVSLRGLFFCLSDKLVGYRFHSGSATSRYNKSLLIQQYSSVEFKLALAMKSPSILQSVVAIISLSSTLSSLMTLYSNSNTGTRVPSQIRILRLASFWGTLCSRFSAFLYSKSFT